MDEVYTAYESPVALGDMVRDKISGFQGVAESLGFFLNGCLRIGVVGTQVRDGKVDNLAFDVQQLEVIERNWKDMGAASQALQVKVETVGDIDLVTEDVPARPGGPHDMPTQVAMPTRSGV